jgi:hypothetical protein
MDRVISARVDEEVVETIDALARELGVSKKQVIEEAVRAYAARMVEAGRADVLARTCGAWARSESPDELVDQSHSAFRQSMRRHQS